MASRRDFLKTASLFSAGLAFNGMDILARNNHVQQTKFEKVKIAYVGIGNRGEQDIDEFAKTGMVEVVALCDVDMGNKQTEKVMNMYPNAKRFKDFREMFEKAGNEFEAVCIATPDHSHFPIAMLAMKEGKHVYVEKPMSRTFIEAELMMQMAKKNPQLVTQVGNQGHSEANYFQFKAWQDAGIIKDVTAVVGHMNNVRRWHTWDSNISRLPEADPMPKTMDWDTWLCAVPYHDYNEKYHQGNWRCWYDFGMGALGDWGAHILDTVHEFLHLGLPYQIKLVYSKGHNDYFYPYSSTILFRFAARENMPPVDVTWYDGLDNLPPLPEGYGRSELAANIPPSSQGEIKDSDLNPGKIIYTKDLIFKGGSHGSTLSIIPEKRAKEMEGLLPQVPESPSNHYVNFLRAIRGEEKTRSPFEINGVLSQVFCLGVIAQRLNADLYFDTRLKQFTNNQFANAMLAGSLPRKGWEKFYDL
ncbi:MAG: Gfo/Idh/MocA family oxidoreductase [Bacteroidaceae bacterium]|nr:Gfo/Idh/MocA family oxidoreductase [Bacteroidaceae bacterium]MBQ8008055.1 Gfo/Idh/MocA family oxidoreductase [Bacteroidaceae bacterium]MBR1541623.1 Gfo/Idh/MocA family oxidoreductase [Bacteroidaceae bacterium]